jgi:hypothetical protein
MHARLFMGKIHSRHNSLAYADLMSRKAVISSPCKGLNVSHIHPHLLLHDAEKKLDPVAAIQFLSLISRYVLHL